MEISILHKANSLQVTEMTTCLRVSHGKALPSILEIAPNFGHDTNALTVFRSSCTMRINVLRYRNHVAHDKNHVAWDASRERVVIYFSAVL